jgi:hypothetical protein
MDVSKVNQGKWGSLFIHKTAEWVQRPEYTRLPSLSTTRPSLHCKTKKRIWSRYPEVGWTRVGPTVSTLQENKKNRKQVGYFYQGQMCQTKTMNHCLKKPIDERRKTAVKCSQVKKDFQKRKTFASFLNLLIVFFKKIGQMASWEEEIYRKWSDYPFENGKMSKRMAETSTLRCHLTKRL